MVAVARQLPRWDLGSALSLAWCNDSSAAKLWGSPGWPSIAVATGPGQNPPATEARSNGASDAGEPLLCVSRQPRGFPEHWERWADGDVTTKYVFDCSCELVLLL